MPDDEGGHLIGHQFSGPAHELNLVAQSRALNRGAGSEWRKMESEWKKALNEGKTVNVKIKVFYDGDSKRPSRFEAIYTIGDEFIKQEFTN